MAHKAERQGEPNLVVQNGSVVHVVKIMVVLVSVEAATPHGVLKKRWPLILGDVALMHLRKSELPSCPHEPVLGDKHSAEFALNGLHPIRSTHQFNVGRKQKTSLDRSIDKNAVTNRKHRGRTPVENCTGLLAVDSIEKRMRPASKSLSSLRLKSQLYLHPGSPASISCKSCVSIGRVLARFSSDSSGISNSYKATVFESTNPFALSIKSTSATLPSSPLPRVRTLTASEAASLSPITRTTGTFC